MDLYEFDSKIPDGAWTWMELLANAVAGYGNEWGAEFADKHHGLEPASKMGRLLGKGAPKDEVRKFRLAFTSLMIHEVIIRSPQFCPKDPGDFQERFFAAVLKLVDPALRENLLHVTNKNIEDHRLFLAGEIDDAMYISRLTNRFLKLPTSMVLVSSHLGIVELVEGLIETVNEATG